MSEGTELKGPRSYRFLVSLLNVFLTILVFWFLGFILDDIDNQPSPSWEKIQTQFQDPALVKQKNRLTTDINTLSGQNDAMHQQQALLQTSTNNYHDTMNQLLDLQKARTITSQEQINLTNATKLYLENQQKFQTLNNAITQTSITLQQAHNQLDSINAELDKQNTVASKEYNSKLQAHNFKIALLKLSLLIPLLLITAYFFKKFQNSIYRPMTIAVGLAITFKIILVMHEHFPSRFFKYFLILALIAFVIRALIKLLRILTAPKANWLLKQYREAYKKLCCPNCEYPIRPGILKYSTFTQDNLKNISLTDSLAAISSYSCPSCGMHLFEKCKNCDATRHSLLRYCEMCGDESNKK